MKKLFLLCWAIMATGPLAAAPPTTPANPAFSGGTGPMDLSHYAPFTLPSGIVVTSTKTALVDASGNDSTGAIGNPARPYLTAQAAYNALIAAYPSTPSLLKLGVGSSWEITLTANWNSNVSVSGAGAGNSVLTINGYGAALSGNSGYSVALSSDNSVALSINVNGGTANGTGGGGGSGGAVTLTKCVVAGINANGAGDPADAPSTATEGSGGTVAMTNCQLLSTGTLSSLAGNQSYGFWGTDGTVNLYGCTILGAINLNGGVTSNLGSMGSSPSGGGALNAYSSYIASAAGDGSSPDVPVAGVLYNCATGTLTNLAPLVIHNGNVVSTVGSGTLTLGGGNVVTPSGTGTLALTSQITGGVSLIVSHGLSPTGTYTTGTVALSVPAASGSTSISTTGTTTLSASGPVNSNALTFGAGTGTYTSSIVLSDSGVWNGQLYELYVSLPASTNPTINIYDASTGGTLLATPTINGVAGTTTLQFFNNGTAWSLYPKGALLQYRNLADLQSAATARTNLGLTSTATITLPVSVANGGTGTTTIPTGDIMIGAGAGAITVIAPGTGVATGLAANVNSGSGFETRTDADSRYFPLTGGTVTGTVTLAYNGSNYDALFSDPTGNLNWTSSKSAPFFYIPSGAYISPGGGAMALSLGGSATIIPANSLSQYYEDFGYYGISTGTGRSYQFNSNGLGSSTPDLQMSDQSQVFSFDTGVKGNAAAPIICADVRGGVTMTANTTGTITFNTAGNPETIYNTGTATLSTATITLPSTSSTGQILTYESNGAITTLTITGGTMDVGATLPTTLAAATVLEFQEDNTTGHYVRRR